MMARNFQFVGVSNGINTTTDENGRLTSSSDFDPSSSEQSADTVIYVGPSEETDGEHPPVCIPSLNSADNRGVLSKVLRESDIDYHRASKLPIGSRSVPASPLKTSKSSVDHTKINTATYSPVKKHHLKTTGFHSAHSSPVRTIGKAVPDTATGKLLEELWIDGPRISKSKIAEARNVQLMRKEGQKMFGKREMWVDGPMKKGQQELAYGFMDSHKKSMIRRWVENQSLQLQNRIKSMEEKRNSYKALTVFKTCENGADTETEDGRGQGSGQEDDNEAKALNRGWQSSQSTEETDLNKSK
jgi:kinesin family protein 26